MGSCFQWAAVSMSTSDVSSGIMMLQWPRSDMSARPLLYSPPVVSCWLTNGHNKTELIQTKLKTQQWNGPRSKVFKWGTWCENIPERNNWAAVQVLGTMAFSLGSDTVGRLSVFIWRPQPPSFIWKQSTWKEMELRWSSFLSSTDKILCCTHKPSVHSFPALNIWAPFTFCVQVKSLQFFCVFMQQDLNNVSFAEISLKSLVDRSSSADVCSSHLVCKRLQCFMQNN